MYSSIHYLYPVIPRTGLLQPVPADTGKTVSVLLAQCRNVDYVLEGAAPEGHGDHQSCPLADFKQL